VDDRRSCPDSVRKSAKTRTAEIRDDDAVQAAPRKAISLSDTVPRVRAVSEEGAPPLVIANPAARRGRAGADLDCMFEALQAALGSLDRRITERPGHAEELAAAAAGERRPLVISLGGDGTLNEIVNGLLGAASGSTVPVAAADRGVSDGAGDRVRVGTGGAGGAEPAPPPPAALPPLGVVSTGTGGDFGRSLGLERRLAACVAALVSGHERAVDVGRAVFTRADGTDEERYWVNVLSAGIGGLVDIYSAAVPHWLGGRIAYGQAALRGIVACPRVTLRCRSILPDGSADERFLHAHTVAVCNGHTFGGGMRIAPSAKVDDGLLEVVSFETKTKLQLIRRFHTVYSGRHLLETGVNHFTCRSLELTPIEVDGRPLGASPARRRSLRHGLFPLDIDGDPRGDVPVRIDLLPQALRVLV
jgi:diacylglycerol kinase (ATP)